MLRKFRISNFYSIKEPQELDLVVAKNAPALPERFAKPTPGSDDRIPKIAVIFGPNASGKTNILRALSFLKWFADSSFDLKPNESLYYLPFNDEEGNRRPTELSVEFDARLIESQPHSIYRYELHIQNGSADENSDRKVIFERLAYAPRGKFRKIFERQDSEASFGSEFEIGKSDPRGKMVRPNASVISTFAKLGHSLSGKIVKNLESSQTNLFISKMLLSDHNATQYYYDNPEVLDQLKKQLRTIDLGIEDVQIFPGKEGIKTLFKHIGVDHITLAFESQGTQNFYKLFPYLNHVLNLGGVAVIDDLDNDIHSLLLPEIVSWFYDEKRNPHNAQLIISCHNATLLEHLVKEEVFFTEKNIRGETEIYGLKNIQGVRRDTNIYSKYLGGVFGAVPHIG